MSRLVILLITALVAITFAECTLKFGKSIDGLKSKLKGRFGGHSTTLNSYGASHGGSFGSHGSSYGSYDHGDRYRVSKPYGGSYGQSDRYGAGLVDRYSSGGHGGSASASASALSSGSGSSADAAAATTGGSGSASARASAMNEGHSSYGSHGHGLGGHGGVHGHGYDYDDYEGAYNHGGAYGGHAGGHASGHMGAHMGGHMGGSAAAAANVVSAPARPLPPVRPVASIDSYKALGNYARPHGRFVRPHGGSAGGAAASSTVSGLGAAASSASSAAVGMGAGASAAAAHTGHGGAYYPSSQIHAAAAGTYSNSEDGRESSAYKRATEHLQEHEDGHRDDNHYYKSDTYGKAEDENMHEAFNKNDEDIEQTPTVFRSKKSGENYVMDYNKNRRETGSGVLAKDKHSSGFNRNTNKFIEDVDQKHSREGAGILENSNHVSTHSFDDGDEEIYDSDGFGAPAHLHGARTRGGAAASSAVASGMGGSAAAAASASR